MTPDDLPLPTLKQQQLQTMLASAGVPDGLQACIDEAEATVAFHCTGYTVSDTLTASWTKTLAVWLAYAKAMAGVPPDLKALQEQVMQALRDVSAGKFPAALATESPAVSAGAVVSETCDVDDTLR